MRMKGNEAESVTPAARAQKTDRWTERIFRALTSRVARRWRFVSFRGTGGKEWRGIVDLIAIRKNTIEPCMQPLKRGDLFDIVLIQVKGGSARPPTVGDRQRLRTVAAIYNARDVVLFEWKHSSLARFSVLRDDLVWEQQSCAEIFGT
jgi:hypothetical protein